MIFNGKCPIFLIMLQRKMCNFGTADIASKSLPFFLFLYVNIILLQQVFLNYMLSIQNTGEKMDKWPFPKQKSEVTFCFVSVIAELRRPEGPPSGAPYSSCRGKIKETHGLIFSWLSWLAVLLVGAYARRRRSCPTWRSYSKKRDIQP